MFAMIATWLFLLMVGSGVLLMLLLMAAITNRSPAFAAAIGGVVLLAGVSIVVLLFGMAAPATLSTTSVSWSISIGRALLFAAVIAVFAITIRSANSPSCGRRRGWWPVLLVPALLAMFFFASVRVEKTRSESARTMRQMAVVQQDVARGHLADIHTLMDQADAPRIALRPDPPLAPSSPSDASASNENGDAKESATAQRAEAESTVEADASSKETIVEVKAVKADSAEAVASAKSDKVATASAENTAEDARETSVAVQEPSQKRAGKTLRPSWIDDPPKRIGNTHRQVVVAGEYKTVEECYQAADVLLLLTTYDHLMQLAGNASASVQVIHDSIHVHDNGRLVTTGGAAAYPLARLAAMGIGIDYVRREIAKDEYFDTTERSFGPMKTLYTLVEFTPAVDRELRSRWEASRRGERFAVVGMGAAAVLGLLGMVWGLLKIDTVTKGYYTKRLFLGVPAAIIGGWLLLTIFIEMTE